MANDFVNNEVELGPNWTAAPVRPPIVPGQPAPPPVGAITPVIPSYLQGVLAPNFQHDTHFVDTELRTPSAPKFSLMPLGPQQNAISSAQINSAVRTTIASIPSTPAEITGLTSIGLIMPSQFVVGNSPLTENGDIDVSWATEPFGTYLGVSSSSSAPFPDAIASNTTATSSTNSSITTGGSANELVMYFAVGGVGGSAYSTPTGGTWSNIDIATTSAGSYYQVFGANSTVSETAAYIPAGGATSFVTANALVSLGCSSAPTLTVIAGGQHGSVLNGATVTATVSAGQTIFALIMGNMLNAGTRVGSIQDSQGNQWFPLVDIYNGVSFSGTQASAFISLWYCPKPKTGSTTWTLELSTSATGGAGTFRMFSVTNLAPALGTPTFKYISASDIRGQIALVNGGTGANLSNTGGTSQYLAQTSVGAAITVQQPDFGDLAGNNKATKYGGLTLAAEGFPAIIGTRNSTNQSSNQGATNFFGGGASAGLYRVSVYLIVSQAATSSSTLPDSQILFTDEDSGAVITIQATPGDTGNTTSTFQQGTYVLNVKSGTNIQFQWGQVTPYASSGATSMLFAYRARLEYLG